MNVKGNLQNKQHALKKDLDGQYDYPLVLIIHIENTLI